MIVFIVKANSNNGGLKIWKHYMDPLSEKKPHGRECCGKMDWRLTFLFISFVIPV